MKLSTKFSFCVLSAILVVQSILTTFDADGRILTDHLLSARTNKCWTLDRLSNKNIVSCASTGVGFYGYAYASKLGIIPKETASRWIRTGFDNMLRVNAGNDGWLYHFVSNKTEKPILNSEISSIDSIIFYISAEKAAVLLKDNKLLKHILKCKNNIKINSMIDSDGYFAHSFYYEQGKRKLSKWRWKNYSEGILIYKYLNKEFNPIDTDFTLPLFVFFYPLAFYDDKEWVEHLGRAIDFQLRMTGRFGYSAMDGINNYVVNSPYYISPLAVYSCVKFFPDKANLQLSRFGVDKLTQSVSVNGEWMSPDRVLLDDGIALLLKD